MAAFIELLDTVIGAVTESGDLVVDSAAGGFSVMDVARQEEYNTMFIRTVTTYINLDDVTKISVIEDTDGLFYTLVIVYKNGNRDLARINKDWYSKLPRDLCVKLVPAET